MDIMGKNYYGKFNNQGKFIRNYCFRLVTKGLNGWILSDPLSYLSIFGKDDE